MVEVLADQTCTNVMEEVRARVDRQPLGWHDPHNNGTYWITAQGKDEIELQRLTGDKKYTDKMVLTLTEGGLGRTCLINGCSESQVLSIQDFSTNYCNLRMLYCGEADGCKPVLHELLPQEKWAQPTPGAGTDQAAMPDDMTSQRDELLGNRLAAPRKS
eukprot:CAMPEP_0170600812 /NCGR_PEP_ID=MMETSP0224-20130122/17529_1 /TAXON_ID=285029 /ORGANISM="Togula jolla, Strain CCCM 725" /LENGTH=158 /DNA_ID=CAMNT_0010925553 /DNA_START=213 /DNA_END=684 /DNA_ORIENTATION=+